MILRFIFTAAISAFLLIVFPSYSLAQVDHSGHGPAQAGNAQGSPQTYNPDLKSPGTVSPAPSDRTGPGGGGITGQEAGQSGHGGHGSGGQAAGQAGHGGNGSGVKASGGSDHGGDSGSHQESGPSELDPVRNTLLGGFAVFNALVVAVAAILKKKALKGGVE